MLNAPSAAVSLFAFTDNTPTPARPARTPNVAACATLQRFAGSGRRIVRAITESFFTSNTWLNVFALALHSIVPNDVHPNPSQSTRSPLPRTYPAAAVETTNALSLNLLRS